MKVTQMQATVSLGSGLVAREGSWALVVVSNPATPQVEKLLSLIRQAGGGETPGRGLAHELARFMTELEPSEIPDFGLVADDAEGLVYVLHGPVTLRATTPDGDEEHTGEQTPTWLDGFIDEGVERLSIGGEDVGSVPGFPTDLKMGVVPGGGLSLGRSAGEPAPGAAAPVMTREETEPEVERAPSDEKAADEEDTAELEPMPAGTAPQAAAFTSVDLSQSDLPKLEPLPVASVEDSGTQAATEPAADEEDVDEMIDGVRCIRGHFNHPEARFCAYCGVSMVQVTRQIVRDVRPPLGIIVFGDGDTFSIDSDYVIGRDPWVDEKVAAGAARSITLEDPEQHLSRIHAEIRRDGWDVLVLDRNSSNGTEIHRDGKWVRLIPESPERLEPGAEVRLGGHQFTFDSHHLAGES